MKKYDLSTIMKRAWELVKKIGMSISSGLRRAWKEAKVLYELNDLIENATKAFNYRIKESVWENYGKSRTYFKIIRTRDFSKHYSEYDFGYIDNKTGEYHPGKMDAFGEFSLAGSHRQKRGNKMKEERMLYRRYKNAYADCKTVPGTYDTIEKTIIVLIPEGRMKKSGVRGQRYNYYRFSGIDKKTGEKVETTIKAITGENAIKQLLRDYDKNIEWDLSY